MSTHGWSLLFPSLVLVGCATVGRRSKLRRESPPCVPVCSPCRAAVASPDRCSKRPPSRALPKPQQERDIGRMKSTGGRQPRQCLENFDEHSAFLAFEAGHPSKHKVPVACVAVLADFVVVLSSRRMQRFSAPAIPRGLQDVAEQPIFCRDADVFGGVRHHWEKQYASGQGRSRR